MTQITQQMPSEANHAYFCRLAGLPEDTTAHILARLLGTTVEDIMCARGSWRDELAQRATECLAPDERLKRAAPKLLAALERAVNDAGRFKKVVYEAGTFAEMQAAIAAAKAKP